MGCYIYSYSIEKGRVVRVHVKCNSCLGCHECPKSDYYCPSVSNDYDGDDYSTALAKEVEAQNNELYRCR